MILKNKKEYISYFLYSLFIFLPISLFRDFTPINELKYINIAQNMIKNNAQFILKIHGEYYADKPPLYFWLINISKFIFKDYYLSVIVFLSIIPAILILFIMNYWTKDLFDKKERTIANLMLLSTVMFLGSALVLRMDMLMLLFIVLALFYFYRTYEHKNKNDYEIYLMYLFIFLAVFTKGPSGILVPFISISLFSIFEKRSNLIKDLKLFKGLLFLGTLFFLWFLNVYLEGGFEYLYELIFKQTIGRSINSFAHKKAFYYYAETMFYTFAPWTFFFLYGIFFSIKNYKFLEKIEKFFLIIILSTFLVFSLISGKLTIYLLPIYSFMPYLSMMTLKKSKNKKLVFSLSLIPFLIILIIYTAFISFFTKEFIILKNYYIALFLLVSVVYLSTYRDFYKENYLAVIKKIFFGLALTLTLISFNIREINSKIGLKYISSQIKDLLGDNPNLYIYKSDKLLNIEFYLKNNINFIKNEQILKSFFTNTEKFYMLSKTKEYYHYKYILDKSAKEKIIFQNDDYILLSYH